MPLPRGASHISSGFGRSMTACCQSAGFHFDFLEQAIIGVLARPCHLQERLSACFKAESGDLPLPKGASLLPSGAGKSIIAGCQSAGCYIVFLEEPIIDDLGRTLPFAEMTVSLLQGQIRGHAFAQRGLTYAFRCWQKHDSWLPVYWLLYCFPWAGHH